MLPIKTNRGREALKLLSCFEGIPVKYSTNRPKIIPEVMRSVRSDPANKVTLAASGNCCNYGVIGAEER